MQSKKPQYTHACDIAIQLDMPGRMSAYCGSVPYKTPSLSNRACLDPQSHKETHFFAALTFMKKVRLSD